MLQPQQLRVLVAIREQGSLTAAAASMGYGVPTIAHHLSSLERHFRARLVERDRRGARLTPLGAVLVEEAVQILARLEQAERLVTTQRDQGLTTIRIGTFASMGSQLLPRAIRSLRSRMPVQVEVVEAEPTGVVQLLQAGEIHAGLIYDSAEDPAFTSPELRMQVLLEERYRVLVAGGTEQHDDVAMDIAALADADWICSRHESETSDRVLRRVGRSLGFEPRVLMRTDDLNMIHGLVAEGLACTIIAPSAVDTRFAVRALPAVQSLDVRRTLFVRPRTTSPRAVVELQRILVDVLHAQVA
ncbi:LysR family transcriptional regulator [Agrococcus sp. Marseille-P2731]|uniref:LysR substrate-binding domain-containing protein n=1 Tax=Agrococcus sp. Marseille-P2731 TaxID=1841862 RepID=UPI0009318B16|nr:LysR family transcriptional regulator [Agrococcus sp. Marseille-P2731]